MLATLASGNTPQLGLDLQGGFSVVLQAKNVNGKAPSDENVEKAKEIIRQRVDGLGVAEPEITRQGDTVIVELPGVKNRTKAQSLVGCTAKLEFRPVLARAQAQTPRSTTTSRSRTTTTRGASSSSTPSSAPTTAPAGNGQSGLGAVGDERGRVGGGGAARALHDHAAHHASHHPEHRGAVDHDGAHGHVDDGGRSDDDRAVLQGRGAHHDLGSEPGAAGGSTGSTPTTAADRSPPTQACSPTTPARSTTSSVRWASRATPSARPPPP